MNTLKHFIRFAYTIFKYPKLVCFGILFGWIGTAAPQTIVSKISKHHSPQMITLLAIKGIVYQLEVSEFHLLNKNYPFIGQFPPVAPILANQSNFDTLTEQKFESEQVIDKIMLAYAWNLRKKNTGKKAAFLRDSLLNIAYLVSDLKENLNEGGTFYAHYKRRVLADTEYWVYCIQNKTLDLSESISFDRIKQQFINCFRQKIQDENVSFAPSTNLRRPDHNKQNLPGKLKKLERLINTSVLLNWAIEIDKQTMGSYLEK